MWSRQDPALEWKLVLNAGLEWGFVTSDADGITSFLLESCRGRRSFPKTFGSSAKGDMGGSKVCE